MHVDKQIFVFWTGDNDMSNRRLECLSNLSQKSECKVILVTPGNLNDYILKDHPLHPAYKYLSHTHKADYLRTYFMHFYGGGYSDIKKTTGSWGNAFDDINNNNDAYINGYAEVDGGNSPAVSKNDIPYLIGNCCYICKPNTEFTRLWYSSMIHLMNLSLDK